MKPRRAGRPYLNRACDDEVRLAWKQGAPYLSAQCKLATAQRNGQEPKDLSYSGLSSLHSAQIGLRASE
jgi:hypothetical protein